jgi:predicted DsbA family dithiol-disulfide isomerase
MAQVAIDVFTDVVCPWCYIGVERLEKAREGRDVVIRHHPFMLDPSTPEAGVSIPEMLRRKYGADPRAMFDRVENAAMQGGLPLDLSKQARMYPTARAHTLARFARQHGKEHEVVRALFRANFDEGKNVADPQVLGDIAEAHGLDRAAAERAVGDPAELEQTSREAREASELGIRGVPFFVFGDRLAVSGAQPLEVLVRAMDEAARLPAK